MITRSHTTGRALSVHVHPLRIIIADDEQRVREFYQEVLPRLGHVVVGIAADGRELIEACLRSEPDLVLSDICMPEITGMQAARIVSQQVNVPFIFVSAHYDDSLIEAASTAFSYGYLVKPIRQQDLAAAIPVAMRRHRDRRRGNTESSRARSGGTP